MGLALLEDILKDDGDGVTVFPVIASTGQAAGMFKGEVDRARFQDETNILKMRSFGFGQEVLREAYPAMEFISAIPGSSGVADILNGLEGDLEGAEFINPQIDYKTFFLDAEPNVQELGVTHYYINAWQSPVTLHYLIINKKFFNNLNDKKRALIETAAFTSTQKSHARLLRDQGDALKNIENLGITISKFDDDILNDLLIATNSVLNEKSSLNLRFAEVLDSIKKFVRKERAWINDGNIHRDFRFNNWGLDWDSEVTVK